MTSSMADQPPASADMKLARSVFNKIGETLDNLKCHALPFLLIYDEWKNLASVFIEAETSLERREEEIESVLSGIRVSEMELIEKVKKVELRKRSVEECYEAIKAREKAIDDRCSVLGLREKEYLERLEVLKFDEKEVNDGLEEKERGIREVEMAFETRRGRIVEEIGVLEERKRGIWEECRCLEAKEREIREEMDGFEERRREVEEREREVEERCSGLEEREREIEDHSRLNELRGREVRELREVLEARAKGIVEEGRLLEERKRRMDGESRGLEEREKEVNDRGKKVELREKGVLKRGELLEERKKALDGESRRLEGREKEINEWGKKVGLREKELVKRERLMDGQRRWLEEREKELNDWGKEVGLGEKEIVQGGRRLEERKKELDGESRELEVKRKKVDERRKEVELREEEIVEGGRLLEERKKALDGESRDLEVKRKEVDKRCKEAELRDTKNKERENELDSKEKELCDLRRKLELKEKDIDKVFRDCYEELRVKKDQLVEHNKALGLKEMAIIEQRKEVELKQVTLNEQLKALELTENEISRNREKMVSVQGYVGGTKTVETDTVGLSDCHPSVVVKRKQVEEHLQESTVKQVEECCDAVELEEEQISETCASLKSDKRMNKIYKAEELKAALIQRCSNVLKQVSVVLKKDMVGKHVKEEQISDTCSLIEKEMGQTCDKVVSVENLPETRAVDSSLLTEIQSVFRNDDAKATASYLIEHAKNDDMWHEKMIGLRHQIPGLIQSLFDEHKHLQAAMCSCVFKMDDVFPPDFLLEAHLEYIQERAAGMVKEGSATAQNDVANMKFSAIKDVLECISDFKLESIYPRESLELRITQLEKEIKERASTQLLMEKRSDRDLEKNAEALQSVLRDSSTPNLSDAHLGSQHEKKRKASSATPLKQNKHARSSSRPRTRHSERGQDAHSMPVRSHAALPVVSPDRYPHLQGYNISTSHAVYSNPYGIVTGRFEVAEFHPGGFQETTLQLSDQGGRTKQSRYSIPVNPHSCCRVQCILDMQTSSCKHSGN